MINEDIRNFLRTSALESFLRYVRIFTTSDENSEKSPTSQNQFKLAELLRDELMALGLYDIELTDTCYVYATLPSNVNKSENVISFCAHMDTSPAVSGEKVEPIIHENYQGGDIFFPDDEKLVLNSKISPELDDFIGENIITASGKTLLGADDKAGIAEIMAALRAFKKFPELKHPEIRVCFTPDEEVGKGTDNIELNKLGSICYTLDGGVMGELEDECFDAFGVKVKFYGINVHPGAAKNRMVNAAAIAARFFAALPEHETTENREKREGFYHLTGMMGDENFAELNFIIRDFEQENNLKRINLIKKLVDFFKLRYPGLKIELDIRDQYNNMKEVLEKYPKVVEYAEDAIREAGIIPQKHPIRGGTDGARLSFMGVPTPNIFTGGLMFHSKLEWIPEIALEKGAEVVIRLAEKWI